MFKEENIIALLDIGSTKITCIIIRRIYLNNFEVVGISDTNAKGIKSGMIVDLGLAKLSILQSIKNVTIIPLKKVKQVYISLNSSLLISERNSIDML